MHPFSTRPSKTMIAIRRIYDHINPVNQLALEQCKEILVAQFPYMSKQEANEIFYEVKNPLANKFRYEILVAENKSKQVLGLIVSSYYPKENFYFLDYIATHQKRSGGGVGGALYERLRSEATLTKTNGIFFDCLSDDAKFSLNEPEHKQNIARLRFYEKYGARPLHNTLYELQRPDYTVFHLVFESLGKKPILENSIAKKIIKTILETKHTNKCSADYIKKVIDSIKTPTITIRPPKFISTDKIAEIDTSIPADKKICLIINEEHNIHHVKEKGYLESPIRIKTILSELDKLPIFEKKSPTAYPEKHLEEVHDKAYLNFLKKICETIGEKATRYGDIFPIRNSARMPKDIELQIGYYCIDTSTPLNANAYKAARVAVNCALTAADQILSGRQIAYALVRPPGHHAEKKHFGGFCYLNSNAIAANYLSKSGKVAILDIDYHHGNGQQNIFYKRSDVFTVSIHADPEYAYPNFTGFSDEIGLDNGKGFNLNIPLKKDTDGAGFRKALGIALQEIKKFNPTYLVIALGFDVAKGDPSGTWLLTGNDFSENGNIIAGLNLPTVIIQEGGYKNRDLGNNARRFFEGLWSGYYKASIPKK